MAFHLRFLCSDSEVELESVPTLAKLDADCCAEPFDLARLALGHIYYV